MTQISREETKDKLCLTVLGHCDAGRINGLDLCCCAVSMLVFTLMESLKKLNLSSPEISYGGGWCLVRFSNKSKDYEKAKIITDTVMTGFLLLEKSYPSSVCILKEAEK